MPDSLPAPDANYSSGNDYVVEFLGYRFSFGVVDFEGRVVAAAVKLGVVESPELDEDEIADLEDQAQHAAYSIRDYRKRASDRVAAAYPEPERARLLEAYKAHATAPDGADVWLDLAQRRSQPHRPPGDFRTGAVGFKFA